MIVIANKLDCKIVEILDKIENFKSTGIATIEEIKEVTHAVKTAETLISDARYSAEEAKDQAYSVVSECDNAEGYINDAKDITNQWETKIKELEEVKVEADTEEEKKAPAKKLMNNFQAHNQQ